MTLMGPVTPVGPQRSPYERVSTLQNRFDVVVAVLMGRVHAFLVLRPTRSSGEERPRATTPFPSSALTPLAGDHCFPKEEWCNWAIASKDRIFRTGS